MGELQKITNKFRQITEYHNDTCDACGISEKIEEAGPNNNTFFQDYEKFVKLFHSAGVDDVDDLIDALIRLTISYKQLSESIKQHKQFLDENNKKLKSKSHKYCVYQK